MTYANEFADKSDLPPSFEVGVGDDMGDGSFLHLGHPVALARFVAFVKYREQQDGRDVFLRGQTTNYPAMLPALFRTHDIAERVRRAGAYNALLERLSTTLRHTRFRRDNQGAVYQHYGVATPWLDLVDNLYSAIWFATHQHISLGPSSGCYQRSTEPWGWIILVSTRQAYGEGLRYIDLRKSHSSMSVRLHIQHGISAASQDDGMPITTFDYSPFVIDKVRFPISGPFSLQGPMASRATIFPPPTIDDTLRLLLNPAVNDTLAAVEHEYDLQPHCLGRVFAPRYRCPPRDAEERPA